MAVWVLKLPPLTVSVAKRIIDRGESLSWRESQELEIASQAELLNSADFQEAIRSFFEKRAPQYRGEQGDARESETRLRVFSANGFCVFDSADE